MSEGSIAFVPARLGSQRIPQKNFLTIGGSPLIRKTVETIIDSKLFEYVVISTDAAQRCQDIFHGVPDVRIVERSKELSDGITSVDRVVLEYFMSFTRDYNVCCVYPTNVLLKSSTLKLSYLKFIQEPNSSLMGVSKFRFKVHKAMFMDDLGYLQLLFPEFSQRKTQELQNTYVSNGTFYWSKVSMIRKYRSLISREFRGFVVADNEVCDLDEPEDLSELRLKMSR